MKHATKLLLAGIAFLVIGLLVSIYSHRAKTMPPDLLVTDRELGWRPNPAHDWNNAHGFKGADFPDVKPAGITRIVFLGDSSTYQNVEPQGYVEMLADWHQGENCELINAAVPRSDAIDIYVRYERDVLPLNPDVVIAAMPASTFGQHRPSSGPDILQIGLNHLKEVTAAYGQQLYLLEMPIDLSGDVPATTIAWEPSGAAEKTIYLDRLYAVMENSGIPSLNAAALPWTTEEFRNAVHLSTSGYESLARWLDEELIAGLCTPAQVP